MERHGGTFPQDPALIAELPGIGRSTAAAVAAFAFGARLAILDGNVKRVLTRRFGIAGYPGNKAVENALWRQAEALLPEDGIEAYTQGLMDLGATLCTRAKPRCEECPLTEECFARRENRAKDFPGAKPRKALPEKTTAMALLLCNGEIYLEKRPPTGIWGGLWSLPEFPADAPPEKTAAARYGVMVKSCLPLPTFAHTFSHFRLHIAPWLMTVRPDGKRAAEPGGLWLNLEEARGAALPAPVKKLISAIREPT
jgi:A/G-specific adenine glycosylase